MKTSRLRRPLIEAAAEMGIDLNQSHPPEFIENLRAELSQRWIDENMAAMQSSNDWVEKNGLPLEKHRMF